MRQVLVIAGLIIAVFILGGLFLTNGGIANIVGSGQAFTEKAAVSTLRTIHWGQGRLRSGSYVDEDRDGVAEFGTMAQLRAEEPLPSGVMLPAALIQPPGSELRDGVLWAHGYCFRSDLPADVDDRERRFVAFAWPRLSAAGNRVYCINQDEDILESANEAGWIGCENAPPPGSCPSAAEVDAGGVAWERWRGKTNQLRVGAID